LKKIPQKIRNKKETLKGYISNKGASFLDRQ